GLHAPCTAQPRALLAMPGGAVMLERDEIANRLRVLILTERWFAWTSSDLFDGNFQVAILPGRHGLRALAAGHTLLALCHRVPQTRLRELCRAECYCARIPPEPAIHDALRAAKDAMTEYLS